MMERAHKPGVAVHSERNTSSPGACQKPIFYIVDWLPPDFGAVGQYGVLFSREMGEAGRHVRLVGLSSQGRTRDREIFDSGGSLEITRLPVSTYKKSASARRLIWIIKSNFRLAAEVIQDPASRRATVLFTGSPPFMLFFAFFCKWLRDARLVYRITDFYPEVLFAAWGRKPAIFAAFEKVTWYFRRRVDEIQVLGEDQRKLLLAGGIRPERITLKRDVSPVPVSGRERPAPRPPELEGRKILLYSGNYGVAHETETIVKGLIFHHRRGSGRFGLWLNASGSEIQSIVESLRAERIAFARSKPSLLADLPAILAAADAHLISLKPGFSGYVLPSKIYGCLSSRRPIVFVGPRSSDVHLLSNEGSLRQLYKQVEVGDVEGFSGALEQLADLLDERSFKGGGVSQI
jgi:hypothetical protein